MTSEEQRGGDSRGSGEAHRQIVDEGPVGGPDIVEELTAAEGTSHGGTAEELAREVAQQHDRYLRLAAEFDNFRRRTSREKQEAGSRAQAELAAALLESLDDLERVTSTATDGTDAAAFVEGVTMVARKLEKALSGAGLEVVDPAGAPFDPSLHEAIATSPAARAEEDDQVAAVYQRGYLFKGQLLRPARVVVSKWNV